MKRTVTVLVLSVILIALFCLLGCYTAKSLSELEKCGSEFEAACRIEDQQSAQRSLETALHIWESRSALYESLCRVDSCMEMERCLQEMELALREGVYEDGVSAARELQRICREASHIGKPDWADIF